MPTRTTIERARDDRRKGRAPSTQAGEFVREEIEHIREGKHGARSTKQAIAIGLSKARRAGVKLPVPKKGTASARTRAEAARALRAGQSGRRHTPSRARSRAALKKLKDEPRSTVSSEALSRQAKSAARKRSASARSASARKAVRTKGPRLRKEAARQAARTRRRQQASNR